MDWLKLFSLLVVVASVQITADAPKKKIRIHLPQKVKHIHHHKKIYITNHPASSQYAPAFMPSAEGAVAVPSNIAVPAVASMLPLNSVELYDESPTRMPGISSAASKLLPLYRARGYYGPTPTEWEDQDYDLGPPPDPTDGSYLPTGFAAPSAAPTAPSHYPPKRVKILKINEPPRKKVLRKNKPKRVPLRNKPQLQPQPQPQVDEEHPVTNFHEQFYSDIDGSGTIRKIKKPQRVEKIIDGDTEHIHTYSEEHIHKLVFDDGSKLPGVVGIDSVGSMSALAASRPIVPMKAPQHLIAISPESFTRFTAVGSMGTPSHLEYAAYNPREVTHDHIFHDHGELPVGVDLTKDHLPFPTRPSYSNQGMRIGSGAKGLKNKYPNKYIKPQPKPGHIADFSYYESIYAPYNKLRNIQKPTIPTPYENEANIDYRPIVPSFKLKNKANIKPRNVVPTLYFGPGKQVADYRLQQATAPSPYAVSSTVVHEYKPKHYSGHAVGTVGLSKYNKDIYSYTNNNYEFDAYASPSNIYTSENYPLNFPVKKGKKKSISTQNISFGGLDHQTTVDHLQDSGVSATSINGGVPSAFDNTYDQTKPLETSAPSTIFTIRESSPVHPYYSAMAVKALHNGDQDDHIPLAEASNDNYRYAEAPTQTTASEESSATTIAATSAEYYNMQNSEAITTESTNYDTMLRSISNEESSDDHNIYKESRPRYKILALQPKEQKHTSQESGQNYYNADSLSATGKLKYGDKI